MKGISINSLIDYTRIPSPCFVLDERKLRSNLKLIKQVQDRSGATIILAYKGFAMWSVFPIILEYIKGASSSSLHEALLAKDKMGIKPHTYCVAYKEDEFEQISELSSTMTFNSLAQFEKYKNMIPSGVSCGLRVNPEWSDVATDLYNPSSGTSRLGMTSDQLQELPEGIEGLHFHVLCESSAEALETVLDNFEKRFGKYLSMLKWINMGGGHLMTRENYQVDLLVNTVRKFREKYHVEVILEPGSAFAWETGFLKTTILDIVENGGVKTAIIDASFTCHMPDCLEMPYLPVIKDSISPDNSKFKYRIGGMSCLAGDFVGDYGFEKELNLGDSLIFEDMIHYTMVKTTMFNGIGHPSIGIWSKNQDFKLLRTFGYKDYRDKLS